MASKPVEPLSSFTGWLSPRAGFKLADDCMGQFEADEILGMPGVQHLFDAYAIGLFGRIWNDYERCTVRLSADDPPDGQLHSETTLLNLEVTLADEKDRRMAQEHKLLRERQERGETTLEHIDLEKERAAILEAIPRRCGAKAKKYLGNTRSQGTTPWDLLVYVNFSSYAGPEVTNTELITLTEPWSLNFRSIWLLYGARIIRTWPEFIERRAISDPIA